MTMDYSSKRYLITISIIYLTICLLPACFGVVLSLTAQPGGITQPNAFIAPIMGPWSQTLPPNAHHLNTWSPKFKAFAQILTAILAFSLILGIGVTFAEPAIGVLQTAGSSVKAWDAPLLYLMLNKDAMLLRGRRNGSGCPCDVPWSGRVTDRCQGDYEGHRTGAWTALRRYRIPGIFAG